MTTQDTNRRISDTQQEAEKVLATFRIYEPPVPESLVTKIFGNAQIHYQQLDENVYGTSFKDKATDRWYILINNIYSKEVQRFTLFHELYHILQGKPGYSRGTVLGSIEEFYADVFSANLLIPSSWLSKAWAETHDIGQIAKIFGVSKRVVELRLNNEIDFTSV